MTYGHATRRDWLKAGGLILLAVLAIVVGAVVLIPLRPPAGLIAWLVAVVGVSLYLLVRWHARTTAYECATCGAQFTLSVFRDFVSPHAGDRKCLTCPSCGRRGWMRVLVRRS